MFGLLLLLSCAACLSGDVCPEYQMPSFPPAVCQALFAKPECPELLLAWSTARPMRWQRPGGLDQFAVALQVRVEPHTVPDCSAVDRHTVLTVSAFKSLTHGHIRDLNTSET